MAVAAVVADVAAAAEGVGVNMKDRFGIGWRYDLASGILSNLDKVDLVEVIADDYFDKSTSVIRTISTQIPVVMHGVSLGLASTSSVDKKRLGKMARVVNEIEPEFWSEHLAFVRSGGYEMGHLAMPPRNNSNIEGTIQNLSETSRIVGEKPLLENIATLIDPPASDFDEAKWISEILVNSDCEMLLDLHNLYTNSINLKYDPISFLDKIPCERIRTIHIAGGRLVKSQSGYRILDDHLHSVPTQVFDLLTEVGSRVDRPLTVILERDGNYPSINDLLAELDLARTALGQGRSLRKITCPQD